jgi:serine/threonine protein kinase
MREVEVIEKLGQGSYGTAYKVRDKKTGEVVVMKQIPIDPNDPGDLGDKMKEC